MKRNAKQQSRSIRDLEANTLASVRGGRKQSLYFPEEMLNDIILRKKPGRTT